MVKGRKKRRVRGDRLGSFKKKKTPTNLAKISSEEIGAKIKELRRDHKEIREVLDTFKREEEGKSTIEKEVVPDKTIELANKIQSKISQINDEVKKRQFLGQLEYINSIQSPVLRETELEGLKRRVKRELE